MRVIGTAGHVDHGKSTLVRALTGINPDRLKEEQEREMTIDLGFAWMTLPGGESVSIVDVPGHEDFIKNMLAGVGGIDAALLVIAADEGVMPQTREHLAILDLLKVKAGVVALTKADLIFDPEWLDQVKVDVMEVLEGTVLADAQIIPVSARSGRGLPELVAELERLLKATLPRRDVGRARLPIDRIFTMPGFGTIVTGTLIDGQLSVGEEVEIAPKGLKARIRGLQTHKAKVQTAIPGSRVAINLTGVGVNDLVRGDSVVHPGWLVPTVLVDVQLNVLPSAPRALGHNVEVVFFSGSSETVARTRILGESEIRPGHAGWAQLRLYEPAALVKGDRFILRQPSPGITLGGGSVVDPFPRAKHRRFNLDVLDRLETLAHGGDEEVLLAAIRRDEPCLVGSALQSSGLNPDVAQAALATLLKQELVLLLDGELIEGRPVNANALVTSQAGWIALTESIAALVGDYHKQYPLRVGMPREELKSRLHLTTRVFIPVFERALQEEVLVEGGALVHLPGHRAQFSPEQKAQVDRLLDAMARQPYTTPSMSEIEAQLGVDVLSALLEQGKLTKVNNEVCFLTSTYEEMVNRIVEHLRANKQITVAEVRDMFNASRKYSLALMEHLDERRITRRVGDERVLRQA